MKVKVEYEGEVIADSKVGCFFIKYNEGSAIKIPKRYCTIIEEPVVYNVGDIVECAGSKAIVYRVDDKTLNVMDLSGHNWGWLCKKNVKLLKKANYEEEQ